MTKTIGKNLLDHANKLSKGNSELMAKSKMKINILLAIALMCFIGFASCKDDGSGGFPQESPNQNHLLVGKWYDVESTDSYGTIVVFNEKTFTMSFYWCFEYKDSLYKDTNNYYENYNYLLNNDTLHIFASYPPAGKKIEFLSSDTVFIEYFIPGGTTLPSDYHPVTLYRSYDHEAE